MKIMCNYPSCRVTSGPALKPMGMQRRTHTYEGSCNPKQTTPRKDGHCTKHDRVVPANKTQVLNYLQYFSSFSTTSFQFTVNKLIHKMKTQKKQHVITSQLPLLETKPNATDTVY